MLRERRELVLTSAALQRATVVRRLDRIETHPARIALGLAARCTGAAPPGYAVTQQPDDNERRNTMLYWAAVFFIIALVAAVLGFGGIAAGAAGIAKILFFIFLIAFIVSLLMGVFRRV